ncbi:hypothetical protein [Thioalkalivibrio sp. ALM2T]|uniref:hypothetical protein n=1 Tax=Thioalkalivibrio sp. ALM2T TaxID=1158184 RepID=UPI000376C21B|nr:hypothetical protein [Thioalkalivibrio sp. ALM2T]
MQEIEIDELLEELKENSEISESYVLAREIRLFLNVRAGHFSPELRVKVYKSTVLQQYPYHFRISHHAQTPHQAGPYYPSCTWFETEEAAIEKAIFSTTRF